MIPKEIIDEINARAHIEEVVGDYLSMKKRGVNYIARCPFHNEKTPSFTISPAKGIYKCFGCGRAGNAVNFIMEHEHYSYPEALRHLAAKYGVEIPEVEITDEQKAVYDHRESIYIILAKAEEFYIDQYNNSETGKNIVQPYVKERSINEQSVSDFKIGFSPEGWSEFSDYAIKNGYSEEYLIAAGLSIKTEKGHLIDRFRNRLMFPIHSISGRTIAFGGRILKQKDKKEAKYINSPDTEVYNKSEVLFGLYQAKKAIKKNDLVYLVEGYTDVIALHQKGVDNVVASSGTSLTQGHLHLARRYTENICFLFDGDSAGIKASLRAIDLALEEGLNVFALALPDGEDPDSYAKAHDTQEVKDYLETEIKDFIVFKTELLVPETEDNPIKKAEVISQIVHSVALVPNQLKRSLLIQQCAKLLKLSEEVLLSELNKSLSSVLKQREKKHLEEKQEKELELASFDQEIKEGSTHKHVELDGNEEEKLLQFLLRFGHLEFDEDQTVAEHIFQFIEEHEAEPEDVMAKTIFLEYKDHFENWGEIDLSGLFRHEDEAVRHRTILLTEEKYEASKGWVNRIGMEINPEQDLKIILKRTMNRYKLSRLQNLIRLAREQIKTEEDQEEVLMLLEVLKELFDERRAVANELGIVVN